MNFDLHSRSRPVPGAQVISRAAAVLRAIGNTQDRQVTLSGIAKAANLKIPTARRMLQALANEGFLIFDTQKKTYQIGPSLIALTAASDEVFAIRDILMAACREVAAKTSDTTVLMVRRGDAAVCVGRVEGAFPIRVMTLDVGSLRPLGAGSGSLALIAFLPDGERDEILRRNEKEFARFGLTLSDVVAQAQHARTLNYTFNPGKILPGVAGIGVPIFRDRDLVGSISVAAIESRLDQPRRVEIKKIIKQAVARLQNFHIEP